MKRPTMLVKAILADASLDLDLSVERDFVTIRNRCEHEGFSFLTITLPVLSDALERGLEEGTFTCPTSFSRHGKLPRFLGGFFQRVFDSDGRLLPDACPYSVKWIRQICRFFKKPKIACLPRFNIKAINHFLEVEDELRRMTPSIEREDLVLDKVAGILWSQVFPEPDYAGFVCHHGPGVTADSYNANARYRISKWNTRSEFTFPSDLHCYPNYGAAAVGSQGEGTVGIQGPEYLDVRDELPVRVVFVPKTLTAPRVIAIEPSHVQYMQQSLKDYCYDVLERHRLTRNSIRFTDQTPNQLLAYSGSVYQRLATLDLKDASDRVHLHLVQRIFKTSGILPWLEDSRSLHATLPNGRNIVLTKFASMGSAMCFPVEAMVFYTLVLSAMHQLDGRRPSSRSIQNYSESISIYGDDIIVPVEYTDVVVRYLESYALKVNVNKSFSKGNFRESCGADFFKGVPVNPVYAREVPHDNSQHWGASQVMSWNATADLFYMRGMWTTAQTIRTMLSRVVRRTIPKTRKLGSGLAHLSFLYDTDLFWNRSLHNWKQKRLHYVPVKRKDHIDGDELACLNKWGIASYLRDSGKESSHLGVNPYHDRLLYWRRLEGINSQSGSPGDGRSTISRSGGRSENPEHRAPECDESVCGLQDSLYRYGPEIQAIQSVASPGERIRSDVSGGSNSPGIWDESDYCLTDPVVSDPLLHLFGDSTGLDFQTSTKRGCFKSKSRWVSLDG